MLDQLNLLRKNFLMTLVSLLRFHEFSSLLSIRVQQKRGSVLCRLDLQQTVTQEIKVRLELICIQIRRILKEPITDLLRQRSIDLCILFLLTLLLLLRKQLIEPTLLLLQSWEIFVFMILLIVCAQFNLHDTLIRNELHIDFPSLHSIAQHKDTLSFHLSKNEQLSNISSQNPSPPFGIITRTSSIL